MKKISIKKIGKKKVIIAIVLIIILIIIISIFKPKQVEEPKIETEAIQKRSIGTSVAATGVIKTDNTQNVVSTLTGLKIESVNVKEGDKISAGDLICKFDTSTIKENLNTAQETLNISKAQGVLGIEGAKRSLNDAIVGKDIQVNMSQSDVNTAYKAYQDAQNQLSAAQQDLENKKNIKNNYTKSPSANQIETNYKNKEKAYQDAQKAYDIQQPITNNAQIDYNRYFGAGNVKLDPNTGTPLATEPQPGQFNPSHDTVKNVYEQAQAKLSNLEKNLNTAKSEYLSSKTAYDNVIQSDTAYQAIVSEVASAEANVNTLKSTVDSLKSAYEKALQAHSSTVSTADSTIANMQDSVTNSELSSQLNEQTQKSQLKAYQDQLKEGVLTATVDGIVKSVSVKPGDIYAGTTIAVIEGVNEFIIESQIDEYDIADIKEGMEVLIKTDSTRDEELKGRITYVASTATENSIAEMPAATPSVATTNNATYKVKISLDSQNDRLRLGMNAKLSIITDSREDVWAVPYEAIHEREDGTKYIEILKNEQTKEKEELDITTGFESSYYVEIISNKLKNGMQVVLPEVEENNSMDDIIEMMGADAGV